MQQLSPMDAMFLYVENERVNNHVGAFYIYDQSTAPGGIVTFKRILKTLEAKLHLVPRYRQRIVSVPGNFDHPYWVDDPRFDIEYHVRHYALPKPGDWRQLCIMVSRLFDRPLDHARPLWALHVIEGLDHVEGFPPGAFAVVNQMHHAMIDGVSGTAMAMSLHDTEPDAEPGDPVPWEPEREPLPLELVSRAYMNNMVKPFGLMNAMGDAMPAAARLAAAMKEEDMHLPMGLGEVPKTRFNGSTSGHRVVDGVSFSLADLKAIKKAVDGATINDVVLAICGGALREYLIGKDELPDVPLVTLSPISVRSDKGGGKALADAGGNEVSGMLVALATDIAEPIERLEAVHQNTLNSKELTNAVGAKVLTDMTRNVPAITLGLAARLSTTLGFATQANSMVNCVITNVPGPQQPVYFCGARMVNQFSLGTVQDGMCLFHAIFSYDGKLTVTVMSDRAVMPDPDVYRHCLQRSFDDLLAAVSPGSGSAGAAG